jgi:hypothetical protein
MPQIDDACLNCNGIGQQDIERLGVVGSYRSHSPSHSATEEETLVAQDQGEFHQVRELAHVCGVDDGPAVPSG